MAWPGRLEQRGGCSKSKLDERWVKQVSVSIPCPRCATCAGNNKEPIAKDAVRCVCGAHEGLSLSRSSSRVKTGSEYNFHIISNPLRAQRRVLTMILQSSSEWEPNATRSESHINPATTLCVTPLCTYCHSGICELKGKQQPRTSASRASCRLTHIWPRRSFSRSCSNIPVGGDVAAPSR